MFRIKIINNKLKYDIMLIGCDNNEGKNMC